MELPTFTIKPKISRILLPRILALIAVESYLFTFGITIFDFETNYIIVGFLLTFLIAISALFYLNSSKIKYDFYSNHVKKTGHKPILYNEITDVKLHTNLWDKLMGTCTIQLYPNMKINFINNTNQVYFYLQKFVQSSRQLHSIQ